MKYKFKSESQVREIQLETDVRVDSPSVHAKIAQLDNGAEPQRIMLGPNLLRVAQPDGSWRRVPFQPERVDPGLIGFSAHGLRRSLKIVGGLKGGVESSQAEGAVVAPMNGQVVKIPASLGQVVKVGEVILILEAMKMENEISAPIEGTLSELLVNVGEAVSPGQTLFSIEALS